MKTWETLFLHALSIIDAAVAAGARQDGWSFGGGTVLMRRHRHRISKDVDIFVPDPQWLGYLTPRLNARAESLASNYLEQAGFLKLYFDEGEIDFVACTPLTRAPAVVETLFGRDVGVETSSEIMREESLASGSTFYGARHFRSGTGNRERARSAPADRACPGEPPGSGAEKNRYARRRVARGVRSAGRPRFPAKL